jgi:hypothetical protein
MFSLLGLPHYMGLSWFIPEHEVISPNIKSIGELKSAFTTWLVLLSM